MRRFLVFSILIVFCLCLFTSCAKEGKQADVSKPNQKNEDLTIDILVALKDQEELLRKAANKYSEENQKLKINISCVEGDDYYKELEGKFKENGGPTIFNIKGSKDIDKYLNNIVEAGDTMVAQYALPSLLIPVSNGTDLCGVPCFIEGFGYVCNKEILQKAGIDPDGIKSYEKFEELVSLLDKKKSELGIEGVFAFPAKDTRLTGNYVSTALFSPEFDGNSYMLLTSEEVELYQTDALKKVLDLQLRNSVKPVENIDEDMQVQLFTSGKVAMIQQGTWIYDKIKEGNPEIIKKIGFIPNIVYDYREDSYSIVAPLYWSFNAKSGDKEIKAAKKFIDWIYTSVEGKEIFINETKRIPAYSTFDADKVENALGKLLFKESSRNRQIYMLYQGYPENFAEEVIGKGILEYSTNQVTWEDFIKKIKEKWAKEEMNM